MFWFIVAVILGVIVWRQRANKKREVAAAYQQGAKAGRQALASEIAALKKDGKVSQKKLFELLALPKSIAQAPVTATQKTVQLDDDELETARTMSWRASSKLRQRWCRKLAFLKRRNPWRLQPRLISRRQARAAHCVT